MWKNKDTFNKMKTIQTIVKDENLQLYLNFAVLFIKYFVNSKK